MAIKFLNGIDVEGSMNIVASDIPNLDASKVTSGTFSTSRIPNLSASKITSGTINAARLPDLSGTYQPAGNYLTSIPSEYLTQTEGDARYLTSLPNNAATFTNNITLNNSATTADFIAELTNEHGAFQNNYKAYKVTWSYAGNSNLDVGFESVELAGCLIECWGGTYKHVRLTRPTTGTGGRSIYVYNDQGSGYAPGWRQIWTSDEFSSTNVSNWNTAYGWGNHASAGYLTSLPSHSHSWSSITGKPSTFTPSAHNHDSSYDAIGSANAVNDRIDNEVLPAIPFDNNQLANGAGYITGIPSEYLTQTEGDGRYLQLSGGSLAGDIYSVYNAYFGRVILSNGIQLNAGSGPNAINNSTQINGEVRINGVFRDQFGNTGGSAGAYNLTTRTLAASNSKPYWYESYKHGLWNSITYKTNGSTFTPSFKKGYYTVNDYNVRVHGVFQVNSPMLIRNFVNDTNGTAAITSLPFAPANGLVNSSFSGYYDWNWGNILNAVEGGPLGTWVQLDAGRNFVRSGVMVGVTLDFSGTDLIVVAFMGGDNAPEYEIPVNHYIKFNFEYLKA